ncbi:unnamed protein product, partial [Sphagnum balticum]
MASWSRKIDTHIKHSADARQLSAHALTDKREKDSIMDTFMREHEVGSAERLCVMGGGRCARWLCPHHSKTDTLRPSTSGSQQATPVDEHQSQLIEEAVDMDISEDEQDETHTATDQPQVDCDTESTMKQLDGITTESPQKTHDYNETESIHSIASLDESADELVAHVCCTGNYLQQSPTTSTSKPASVISDGVHQADDDLGTHETICDPFHPDNTSSDVSRLAGESTECDVLDEDKPADIHADDTSHTINVDSQAGTSTEQTLGSDGRVRVNQQQGKPTDYGGWWK